MFVPIFLTGGCFGTAFAQSVVRSPAVGMYAAVGMASFIAAAYKTPLAAVVFVAEATGDGSFINPALVGAARTPSQETRPSLETNACIRKL